jgi:hypothetical protein
MASRSGEHAAVMPKFSVKWAHQYAYRGSAWAYDGWQVLMAGAVVPPVRCRTRCRADGDRTRSERGVHVSSGWAGDDYESVRLHVITL